MLALFYGMFNDLHSTSTFCKTILSLPGTLPVLELKRILHQKIFYGLNLIFWIVMGCGIARFGGRGLKTTET